jgi:FkbM family methyltransferase
MSQVKRFFKRNSHNVFFKGLAGFGRSLNRFYENRNHDFFSNGELTVVEKLSTIQPSVIIDGGANIGDYAFETSKRIPDCKIYSFEPVDSTFRQLKAKVEGRENIIPVKKGLYKENATKEINLFNSNAHSSLYELQGLSYQSNQKQKIELLRGDDFLKEQNIDMVDFLKIDVEGAEYDALLGFENSFKQGKIKAVQFEYGYINISTKKLLIDFYTFFEAHHYMVGKIFPRNVEFRKYQFKHEDFIGPNFIAVKKSEIGLINLLRKS